MLYARSLRHFSRDADLRILALLGPIGRSAIADALWKSSSPHRGGHRRKHFSRCSPARVLARRPARTEGLSADLPLLACLCRQRQHRRRGVKNAGLPEPIRIPERSRTVDRLVAAGGIVIGKTNLDQLACGLVGTRSPHGVPRNPYNPAYIPGGSSSGSAVAVSRKLVSFALGTIPQGRGVSLQASMAWVV